MTPPTSCKRPATAPHTSPPSPPTRQRRRLPPPPGDRRRRLPASSSRPTAAPSLLPAPPIREGGTYGYEIDQGRRHMCKILCTLNEDALNSVHQFQIFFLANLIVTISLLCATFVEFTSA